MKHPPLGSWGRASERFYRSTYGNARYWYALTEEPKRGLVIGWRTLKNGTIEYDEFVNSFRCTSTVRCLLVVFDGRQNPVRVPLDAFEVEQGE